MLEVTLHHRIAEKKVGSVSTRDIEPKREALELVHLTMMLYPSSPEAALRFLKFVNASPTPFHAVHNTALRLEKAGFQKVSRSTVQ